MEENWEARVIFSPGRITNNVYLSRRRRGTGGVREFLTPDDIVKTVTPDQHYNDDELVFARLDDEQITALMIAFDKHGIKRPDAGFTDGKLVATEKHLEDMRRLVLNPAPLSEIEEIDKLMGES